MHQASIYFGEHNERTYFCEYGGLQSVLFQVASPFSLQKNSQIYTLEGECLATLKTYAHSGNQVVQHFKGF